MAYGRQLQIAMDRLDQSLARLRNLVKRGDTKAAINFMEEGELKERYGELMKKRLEMIFHQLNGLQIAQQL